MKKNSINKTNFSSVLQKYIEYNVSVNFSDDVVIFTLCFPEEYNTGITRNSQFSNFRVTEDTLVKNRYYFGTNIDEDYTDLFDFIDDIVNINKDYFKKIELFKQKSDELLYLFNNTSYEELKNITFVYGSDVKTKRKYIRKNTTLEPQTTQYDEDIKELQVGLNGETIETVQNEVDENDVLQVQVGDKFITVNEGDVITKI